MSGSGRKDVEQEGLKDEFCRTTRDLGAATNTDMDAGITTHMIMQIYDDQSHLVCLPPIRKVLYIQILRSGNT